MSRRHLVTAFALLVIIIALLLIPPSFLASLPSLCLNRRLFGFCPGCGTIRALSNLFHGNIRAAIATNPNSLLLGPLLVILVLLNLARGLSCKKRGQP
ncbi:MAG: DUF2752 domain-containing protein [candidate division WOR-3 bacterium]